MGDVADRAVPEGAGAAATLWELAAWRAATTPAAPMFQDPAGDVSFGEFARRCERVAAGLFAAGVGADTPVSWQLPTRIDTALVMVALSRLGARQNPMLPNFRERDLRAVMRQTSPAWLIVPRIWRGFDHAELARQLASEWPALEIIVVDDGLPDADPAGLPAAEPADRIRYIYSTSGTTADPKCALHTEATLLSAGRALTLSTGVHAGDAACCPVPFAHVGVFSFLVMMFERGVPTTLVDPWDTGRAVALINRYGATIMGGSTAHFTMLLAEQRKAPAMPLVPTLQTFTGGGALLPPETFRQLRDELGVRATYGYGMTECPTIAMGTPSDSDVQLAETQGAISAGLGVRILDDAGLPVEPGAEGEIEIRGPMVCRGYVDESLTAEAFSNDGWFHTGDRGRIREDGHIVLTGRSKDVIIRKGENVSALEVETVLQLVPGVGAVAVIGLPDADRGERVCAVFELVEGATPPTLDEVRQVCEGEGLMMQKVPEQVEIVDAMPRSGAMKILKHELRARFVGTA